jgi:hypothetical protein
VRTARRLFVSNPNPHAHRSRGLPTCGGADRMMKYIVLNESPLSMHNIIVMLGEGGQKRVSREKDVSTFEVD